MTLRFRLTVIFALLLALVLFVFGGAVYLEVDRLLIDQIDQTLKTSAQDMSYLLYVDRDGKTNFQPTVGVDERLVIQLRDQFGNIVLSNTPILESSNEFDPIELKVSPLDPEGLDLAYLFIDGIIRTVKVKTETFRVISIPMSLPESEVIGILQLGYPLNEVITLKYNILASLVILGIIAIFISVWVGWIASQRALEPISVLTDIASEITFANDLSKRIPELAVADTEVGGLIHAFNQTLDRLEEIFKSQEQFLADVGHELRTPLTVLRGNADIMRRVGELDEISLKGMEEEIDRMTRMVNDLLFLAKADTGELPVNRYLVELDTLLLEVINQAQVLTEDKKHIEIIEIDQVQVCGDKDRLKQVLLNLLSNAVRYTPNNGTVYVRLGKYYGWAFLSFEDQGPGIPKEMIEKIFDRFFRMEEARTRRDGSVGFGLGLPISDLIVKTHGGRIAVDSRVGIGSKFIVQIPLARKNCPKQPIERVRDVPVLEHIN